MSSRQSMLHTSFSFKKYQDGMIISTDDVLCMREKSHGICTLNIPRNSLHVKIWEEDLRPGNITSGIRRWMIHHLVPPFFFWWRGCIFSNVTSVSNKFSFWQLDMVSWRYFRWRPTTSSWMRKMTIGFVGLLMSMFLLFLITRGIAWDFEGWEEEEDGVEDILLISNYCWFDDIFNAVDWC